MNNMAPFCEAHHGTRPSEALPFAMKHLRQRCFCSRRRRSLRGTQHWNAPNWWVCNKTTSSTNKGWEGRRGVGFIECCHGAGLPTDRLYVLCLNILIIHSLITSTKTESSEAPSLLTASWLLCLWSPECCLNRFPSSLLLWHPSYP